MLNFKELKERVRIVDVLLHYGIRLRCKFGSEYASAACPLPTHPEHDKGNNCFCVHIPTNRFQCKHPNCAGKNGVGEKWGDCINLVMVLERKTARDAGLQIETWFPQEKSAPHNGERRVQGAPAPLPHTSEHISSEGSVKYMQTIDKWLDALLNRDPEETDEAYWKRVRNGIKSQLILSFRNGQRKAKGLPYED